MCKNIATQMFSACYGGTVSNTIRQIIGPQDVKHNRRELFSRTVSKGNGSNTSNDGGEV